MTGGQVPVEIPVVPGSDDRREDLLTEREYDATLAGGGGVLTRADEADDAGMLVRRDEGATLADEADTAGVLVRREVSTLR